MYFYHKLCTYPPRYYYADPPLYRISPSSLTPTQCRTQWLCVVMTSYDMCKTTPSLSYIYIRYIPYTVYYILSYRTSLEDYQKILQFTRTVFYLRSGLVLGLPAASTVLAAGRRLPSRNSQNSNYARRFSQGFSRSEWWVVRYSGLGGIPYNVPYVSYRMECSRVFRVLDKSSKTIQYISVLYDIFTLL